MPLARAFWHPSLRAGREAALNTKHTRENTMHTFFHILTRRGLLAFVLAALTAGGVWAADWPDKPLRIIVPYSPGGQTDIVARTITTHMSQTLGQPIILDNKPGANSTVGTTALIRDPADGYTMEIVAGSTMVLNPLLYSSLPYDVKRDLRLLAVVVDVPLIMVVPVDRPYKTVAEFVDYVKANRGKINFASTGIGSSLHLTGELFADKAGLDMVHVPYKGSAPAMTDVIGGQVDVIFDAPGTAMPQVKSGKVRALAVTSASPAPFLPGVPTISSTLPGFETGVWYGIAVRQSTPEDVAQKLKAAIDKALSDPALQKFFTSQGVLTHQPDTQAAHEAFMDNERAKWQALIGARKISMD
jgi:tripartite-type tricarboxylate transporter receptor subunit TctC